MSETDENSITVLHMLNIKLQELYSIIEEMESRIERYKNIIITQENYIKYLEQQK
jgi:hypothetical protein